MFFKVSLALLLLVHVRAQTPGPCVDNTFICSDCTSLDACFGGTRYPITCTAGQVCGNSGVDSNIDGCFDISDSSNTKQSQCSCDASATDPSFIADGLSEDPAAYLACLPGSSAPESLVCTTAGEIFLDGQNPPCGAAPPTTTAGPTTEPPTTPAPYECSATGFYRDLNSCNKYWLCNTDTDANPTEANCAAGESFNEVTLACFDPCDPSAVTFNCDGVTGGVADSIDCSIFHICVNGAVVGVPVPCADGEIFDGTGCVTGTDCPSATDACNICPTTVAPSTFTDESVVSGASDATSATPATDASTSGPGSSTAGSDSSTSGTDSSTSGSDSSTSGTDSSTPASDSSTQDSGSPASVSGSSDSSASDSSNPTTVPGVTGIPDCSTASQAGYYANSASCSVFYSCEDDDAGGFVLKEYTCPGSLVFDPVNNYCNLASLVPGC